MRAALVIATLLLFTACRTTQPVTPTKNESETKVEYRDRIVRDTIHVTDTERVVTQGDTIVFYKTRTKYVEHIKVDSIYIFNTDSIYIEKPVIVYKEPTFMQRVKAGSKIACIILALAAGLYIIYKIKC